jgi:hypothetical protein
VSFAEPAERAPHISVLIARASRQDGGRLAQTLQALRAQDCTFTFEVLVVDRIDDAFSRAMRQRFAEVRWEACDARTTLPQMRTMGLRSARAALVAVTEDHCVPSPAWLSAFAAAFERQPQAVAAGGSVRNGLTDTNLDWATYLCEYAAFAPPWRDGPCTDLPGMNVAYRRDALLALPSDLLTRGFWEATAHAQLQPDGELIAVDDAVVDHCKRFSLRGFVQQRFIYSRHYAGARFASWPARAAAALASPLLLPLLSMRLWRALRGKPDLRRRTLHALPYLLLFHGVCALGECIGYVAGPGASLQEIE